MEEQTRTGDLLCGSIYIYYELISKNNVRCAYLGAPIPACVAVRNTVVPQARGINRHVGDYGGPLLSTCTDSGWQTPHRGIQHILFHDIRDHGGAAQLEIAGLFTDTAEQLRAVAPPARWEAETREGTYMGYVPDISSRL